MSVQLPSETPAGRAWLEKYLHPPSVQKSTYAGIPDNNMSPVTTLAFETVNNIPTVIKLGANSYSVSDMFFLQTTGGRVVAYIFVRHPDINSNNWFQHPQYPAIINDSYDFVQNWGSDVSLQRLAYKSCTYYLNATAFNDQGTVTIAQARPSFFNFQSPTIPPVTDDTFIVAPMPDNIKTTPRGSEYDYNAQILDMGDVSGGPYTGDFVPSTPTQVQQSNPKAVTHMAREGAFVPQHWSQPTNRFYNNPDTGNGSTYDLVQNFIRFIMSDRSEHTVRLYSRINPDGSLPAPTLENCGDTSWSDFTIAYVFFSGLTATSLDVSSVFSSAYITVKGMYGIEVQPHVKSSFVFFQQSPPIPDDRALHAATAIVHQVPDGYPSSANDFGTIAALAMNYAPKIIDWIGNVFGSKKTEAKIEKKVVEKVAKAAKFTPPNRSARKQSQQSALNSLASVLRNNNGPRRGSAVNQLTNRMRGMNLRNVQKYPPLRLPQRNRNSRAGGFANRRNDSLLANPMPQMTNRSVNMSAPKPQRNFRISNRI